MIPREDLQDRRLYRVKARNYLVGVYRAETGTFIGLREKFGAEFPDEEAVPYVVADVGEDLPADIVLNPWLGTLGVDAGPNEPLSAWLKEREEAAWVVEEAARAARMTP